jgi:hypothetical protein
MDETTLVYKVYVRICENMHPHIHSNGTIANCFLSSNPFETILKNVFVYNVCARLYENFPTAYNAFKEKHIDGSSSTNALMMSLFDVGNGVSRLRAFQKAATRRFLQSVPKKWHVTMTHLIAPGPLTVSECTEPHAKCILTRNKAQWKVRIDIASVLREWPTVPPTLNETHEANETIEVFLCTKECVRLVLLHELNAFELRVWDLTAPLEKGSPDIPTHPVHAMHSIVFLATNAWDALHVSVRDELTQRLVTLVSAFT